MCLFEGILWQVYHKLNQMLRAKVSDRFYHLILALYFYIESGELSRRYFGLLVEKTIKCLFLLR